jgi:hypothetical protein
MVIAQLQTYRPAAKPDVTAIADAQLDLTLGRLVAWLT